LARYLARRYPGARITALAGDASSRRFWRLAVAGGPSLVLMDYGAPFEGDTDDVRLHRVFESAGLRVARIVEAVPAAGCLVLEDLGDELLEKRWNERPAERSALLAAAAALAAAVAERGTRALERSERAAGPALDAERFRFEMHYFCEHYAARTCNVAPSAALEQALAELGDMAAATPRRVLCHRDFHSRNLLLAPAGELAMVDIQDARWGPDSYDLASLLRDAYIDVPEPWIEPVIDAYLARLADPPPSAEFRSRFEVVAAQRMIKALGTFGYQVTVLGRRRYGSAIPRVVERLRRLLPLSPRTHRVHAALVEARLL
jgi:hypothetical protein